MKIHFDELFNGVTWDEAPIPDDIPGDDVPYVTHTGVIRIGDFSFSCYQLSDGQRVIDAEGLLGALMCSDEFWAR